MAAELLVDLIEESGANDGLTEYSVRRTFAVTGLDMSVPANVIPQALAAPGLPQLFDAHPSVSAAKCSNRQLISRSADTVVIVCTYTWTRLLLPKQWEVGASLSSTETSFDAKGKKLQVNYQALGAPASTPRVVKASMMVPQTIIKATTFQDTAPGQEAMANVGSVNDSTWAGTPAHTWQVTSIVGSWITGNILTGSGTWQVEHTFVYSPLTYNTLAVVRNADGATIPANISDLSAPFNTLSEGAHGNGWKIFCLYPEMDFGSAYGDPTSGANNPLS